MSVAERRFPILSSQRLERDLKELREAVAKRKSSQLAGPDLEPLDTAVCLSARGFFIRYIDLAGWHKAANLELGKACYEELNAARECLNPEAYKGARQFYESVDQKVTLLRAICDGIPIEEVLAGAAKTD